MLLNPYDEVPYRTHPSNDTHPDRLAAVATLFGMQPAPVANCRVLEIGCGDGGNLVPLAYALPGSTLTGVDLAAAPIAAARRMADDLQLTNVRLVTADLRQIGPEYGAFDYIIAHGVYSWVEPDVRDALLRVCGERLAPQGVALVSYNAYPGRHIRQMLREMMRYVTRNTAEPARRLERARSLLHSMGEGRMAPPPWRDLLREETKILLEKDAGSLWHDDLAPINAPVYFHEFAGHAAAHSLAYLGDASVHLMFESLRASGDLPDDLIEREQMLDFLRCRRFRQTLLCRQGIELNREPGCGRMREFLFAAPARRVEGGQIEGINGIRLAPGHPVLEAVAGALGDSYPLPLPFDELAAYAGSPGELCEILFALVRTGFATLHVHDFPCEETVTSRPRASRLARWQAGRSSIVFSACHAPVALDEIGLRLLGLLDGRRDHDAIAGECGLPGDLDERLAWMARMGLLEG